MDPLEYHQAEGARSSEECHQWMGKLWTVQVALIVGLGWLWKEGAAGAATAVVVAAYLGIISAVSFGVTMIREHERGSRHRVAALSIANAMAEDDGVTKRLGDPARVSGESPYPSTWSFKRTATWYMALFTGLWALGVPIALLVLR